MFKKFSNKFYSACALASTALVASPVFAAGGGDAGALLTGVQGGVDEAVLWGIGGVILTIAGIILMIRKSSKASNA